MSDFHSMEKAKPSVPRQTDAVELRKARLKAQKHLEERDRAVKLGRSLAKLALELAKKSSLAQGDAVAKAAVENFIATADQELKAMGSKKKLRSTDESHNGSGDIRWHQLSLEELGLDPAGEYIVILQDLECPRCHQCAMCTCGSSSSSSTSFETLPLPVSSSSLSSSGSSVPQLVPPSESSSSSSDLPVVAAVSSDGILQPLVAPTGTIVAVSAKYPSGVWEGYVCWPHERKGRRGSFKPSQGQTLGRHRRKADDDTTTVAVGRCVAKAFFHARDASELSLKPGVTVELLKLHDSGWWLGRVPREQSASAPLSPKDSEVSSSDESTTMVNSDSALPMSKREKRLSALLSTSSSSVQNSHVHVPEAEPTSWKVGWFPSVGYVSLLDLAPLELKAWQPRLEQWGFIGTPAFVPTGPLLSHPHFSLPQVLKVGSSSSGGDKPPIPDKKPSTLTVIAANPQPTSPSSRPMSPTNVGSSGNITLMRTSQDRVPALPPAPSRMSPAVSRRLSTSSSFGTVLEPKPIAPSSPIQNAPPLPPRRRSSVAPLAPNPPKQLVAAAPLDQPPIPPPPPPGGRRKSSQFDQAPLPPPLPPKVKAAAFLRGVDEKTIADLISEVSSFNFGGGDNHDIGTDDEMLLDEDVVAVDGVEEFQVEDDESEVGGTRTTTTTLALDDRDISEVLKTLQTLE